MGMMRYQPQGLARIARSTLRNGLRAVLLPGAAEVCTGAPLSATVTAPEIGGTQAGKAWMFTGAIAQAMEVQALAYQAPPFSVLVVVRKSATAADALISFGGASSGNGWKIGSGTAASTFRLTYGGVADYSLTNFWDTTGGITVALVTVQGTTARVFRGGAFVGQITVGTPKTPASKPLTIGALHNGTAYAESSTSSLSLAALWSRALSDDEAISLSNSPWQMFDDGIDEYELTSAEVFGTDAAGTPAGVTASASVGSAAASGGAQAVTLGVAAAASVGNVSASAGTSATASPLGVSASAGVGTVTATAGARAIAAGVAAFGQVGSSVASGAAAASPPGVTALAQVGTVTATGGSASSATPLGVSATASVGQPKASGSASAAPAGVSAFASVGQADASAGANGTAAPAGVTAFASVGTVIAAGNIAIPGAVVIDVSEISPARIVVFEGSGSRVVPFEGSGSRVTPFGGSGSRVTPFEGSGSRTVRFE